MVASKKRGSTAGDAALVARLLREQKEGAARLAQMDRTGAAILRNDPGQAAVLLEKLYEARMVRRTPAGYEVDGLPLMAAELTRIVAQQERERKEGMGDGA